MTCTVVSMFVPSPLIINGALGGLVILLAASQLIDFEGSAFKFISRYINMFSIPLLVWFSFSVIIQLARIVTG